MPTSQDFVSGATVLPSPLAFANTPSLPASQAMTQNPRSTWSRVEVNALNQRASWDDNQISYSATDKVIFLPHQTFFPHSEPKVGKRFILRRL
jgi:hypothetical protein